MDFRGDLEVGKSYSQDVLLIILHGLFSTPISGSEPGQKGREFGNT
jgi:hypothetical protein